MAKRKRHSGKHVNTVLAMSPDSGVYSSFGGPSEKMKDGYAKAFHGRGSFLRDVENNTLKIANVVAFPAGEVGAYGAVSADDTVVILYSEDNTPYLAADNSLWGSVNSIAADHGSPPWMPPLTVIPRSHTDDDGLRALTLEVVSPEGEG